MKSPSVLSLSNQSFLLQRGLAKSASSAFVKGYTIRVEGIPESKGKKLTAADVAELFGAFEPYNIAISKSSAPTSPPPAAATKKGGDGKGDKKDGDGKGAQKKAAAKPSKPLVTYSTTFQVPSLRYVREVSASFHGDESWQERLIVKAEMDQYPVLFSNLPSTMTAGDLKKQVEDAYGKNTKVRNAYIVLCTKAFLAY